MVAVLSTSMASAQYDGKGEDEVSRFRPGMFWYYTGFKPAVPQKVRKYDRLIFDLTYNDWVGDQGPFENHWASIGLNTSLMFDIPLNLGNTVSLGVGLSHQFTNIRHNGNLTGSDSLGTTVWSPKQSTQTFKKSVLGGNSFSIPIELRFRKESWRHFKFHIGGKIGYQTNMFAKTVTGSGPTREVDKDFGFPDQVQLVYSAHIRLGLRNWALFASYNFNKLFTNSNSTQLNLVQGGISVSLF